MTTDEKLLCNRLYELIPEEARALLLPLMKETQMDLCYLLNQKFLCLPFCVKGV